MSIPRAHSVSVAVALLSLLAGPAAATAQPAVLAPFDRLVGGEWRLGNTVQVFEWGPGRVSVVARSYEVTEEGRRSVSIGVWYRHPANGAIVGRVVATGMPVRLFEYVTRFEDDVMRSEIATYDEAGTPGRYIETLKFTGEDTYDWRLLLPRPDETEVLMHGTFRRTGKTGS